MSRTTGDFLRLLSILAVFTIHATAASERGFQASHNYFSQDLAGVLLNQIGRFCVPIFVLLSGYGLGSKYRSSTGVLSLEESFKFFRERASKIAAPYLVWTLVFLIVGGRLAWNSSQRAVDNVLSAITIYADSLFLHPADYHFYFFLIILECYLVFPILVGVAARGLPVGMLVWGVMLCSQILFTSPAHLWFAAWGIERPGFPSSFLLYWILYFYTGILFARWQAKLVPLIQRIPAALMIAVTAACIMLTLYEYNYWSYRNSQPDDHNHFHRQAVILYTLTAWVFFTRLDAFISGFLSSHVRLGGVIQMGAGLSFAGYIFHTQILRLLNLTPLSSAVLLLVPILIVLTFGLIYGLHRILPWKSVRTIFGLP